MKVEFQYNSVLDHPLEVGLPTQPDGKWYFWTETWADAYGPYESEEQASKAAVEYGKQL